MDDPALILINVNLNYVSCRIVDAIVVVYFSGPARAINPACLSVSFCPDDNF